MRLYAQLNLVITGAVVIAILVLILYGKELTAMRGQLKGMKAVSVLPQQRNSHSPQVRDCISKGILAQFPIRPVLRSESVNSLDPDF